MAPTLLFAIGVFTVMLLAVFVYVSVRGVTHPPATPVPFDELLRADPGEAAHAEQQHEQERRSPEILEAAATRLRRHRPHLDVTTKVVEGVPRDVILREATEWHADRVVVGSHGYGRAGRTVLGSTAAAWRPKRPAQS